MCMKDMGMECRKVITNTSSGNEQHEIAYGVSGWDDESDDNTYERFVMGVTVKGVDCGVDEWVKCGTLREKVSQCQGEATGEMDQEWMSIGDGC